jgi:hypothetical protein
MKYIAVISSVFVLVLVGAGGGNAALPPAPKPTCESEWCQKVRENRRIAIRLDNVFSRYQGSYLRGTGIYHARAGRKWNVNPFLIAVASGIESTYGRAPCGGRSETHNAWGFLSNRRCITFSSWPYAIDHVTRVIRQYYIDKGYTTVYAIGRRYCPPFDCPNDSWGRKAVYFLRLHFNSGAGVTFRAAVRATSG